MTRYEQGFITKCAERGVDARHVMSKCAKLSIDGITGGISGNSVRIGDARAYAGRGFGRNVAGIMSRNGGISGSISDKAIHNALFGSGVGAAVGLGQELLKGENKRKRYLRSILLGILGGGVLGAAGTIFKNLPDYTSQSTYSGGKKLRE